MLYPPSQKFPFDGTISTLTLLTGAGILFGWSLTEGTGTAIAELGIYDGVANFDAQFADVTLAAGESTRDLWAPNGIEIRNGLTIRVNAGAPFGTLYALPGEIVDAFLATQGYQPIWGGGQ